VVDDNMNISVMEITVLDRLMDSTKKTIVSRYNDSGSHVI